jgi:sulfur carrier protein
MQITVNDEVLMLSEPCTITALLARYELSETPCAVEVNANLVPKRDHDEHMLRGGDRVEIVTLVGGG